MGNSTPYRRNSLEFPPVTRVDGDFDGVPFTTKFLGWPAGTPDGDSRRLGEILSEVDFRRIRTIGKRIGLCQKYYD